MVPRRGPIQYLIDLVKCNIGLIRCDTVFVWKGARHYLIDQLYNCNDCSVIIKRGGNTFTVGTYTFTNDQEKNCTDFLTDLFKTLKLIIKLSPNLLLVCNCCTCLIYPWMSFRLDESHHHQMYYFRQIIKLVHMIFDMYENMVYFSVSLYGFVHSVG